jgi:hypothetical protein
VTQEAGRTAGQRGPSRELHWQYQPKKPQKLPIGHFLGHVQNQLAIFFVGLAQ